MTAGLPKGELMKDRLHDILEQAFIQMSDIAILFQVEYGRFRFVRANKAAYKSGFRDGRYGKFVEDVIPGPKATHLNQILRLALNSNEAVRYEQEFHSTIGGTIGDIVITPLLDDSGVCTHILGIGRDMTEHKQKEEELRRANAFLESFLSSTTDGILITDLNLNIIRISQGFTKMFGWEEHEVIGNSPHSFHLVPKDYEVEHKDLAKRLLKGEIFPQYRTLRKRKDGTLIHVSLSSSPLKGETGEMVGIIGNYRDITDLVLTESKVRESELKYRLIAENSTDLISLLDKNGIVKYTSPSHQAVLGYPLEFYNTSPVFSHFHPDDVPLVTEKYFMLINTKTTQTFEFRSRHENGHWLWIEAKGTPILDHQGNIEHILTTARDITERKRLEKKLRQMAYYDTLTRLPNRRLFQDRFSEEINRANQKNEQVALFFIDLDGFKKVNDIFGHDVGDQVLQEVANRLKSSVREYDMVARLAGDEFTVLLSEIITEEAIQMAERILEALQVPVSIKKTSVQVTPSIGIAFYPHHGKNIETLLKHADQAMYQAKMQGKNNYQVSKSNGPIFHED